jgi:hypothetical protein
VLQGFDGGRGVLLSGQVSEEDLGVGQVRRHFHGRHCHHADPRIFQMQAQEITQLALDLITDSLRAL